jgi:hypothetical protein
MVAAVALNVPANAIADANAASRRPLRSAMLARFIRTLLLPAQEKLCFVNRITVAARKPRAY